MYKRYLFPFLSTLWVITLLLACGIYADRGWNLLFLNAAARLGIVLLALHFFRKKIPLPDALMQKADPEEVYLVIGPYVASWFTTHNDESLLRYERQRRWLAARDATELVKHLNRFHDQGENVRITLFFPFLPDGHDTSTLAINSLMSWTKDLQLIALPEPLPCVFALYACCSQQRYAWDPDHVIWSDGIASGSSESTLDERIGELIARLAQQNVMHDRHLAQRQSTLCVLRKWLTETHLLVALNGMLNNSSVTLTQFLLADYGSGFIRHGAWSRWLDEKYAVLPALAKSRISLALPERSVAMNSPALMRPSASSPAWGLVTLLAVIVIGGSMFAASWYEKHRATVVEALIAQFDAVPDEEISRKYAVLDRLNAYQQSLSHCDDSYSFQNWGFANCDKLLSKIKPLLSKYTPWVVYSSASTQSLFASGDFSILPGQEERLRPLLAHIQNNPGITFLIVGHSDNSGDERYNLFLSEKRAREVRDWIIGQIHTDAGRFMLKGVGDSFPLRNNSTPEGREINRRVEVIPLRPISFNKNE